MGLIGDPKIRGTRAREKRALLSAWLSQHGWTTIEIAAELLQVGRSAAHATLSALLRDRSLSTEVLWIHGRQRVIWGLTAHGLALYDPGTHGIAFERGRLSALMADHAILTQLVRLRAERAGWTHWRPSNRLHREGLNKIPDAEAITPQGLSVAVEVEREIKTRKRYASIISTYLQTIKAGRWEQVVYVTPDGLANRLARVFASITEIPVAGQRVKLEDRHHARFVFLNLNQWPPRRENYEPIS